MAKGMKRKNLQPVFEGFHNSDLERSCTRLLQGKTYQNLSTVWVTPIRDKMVPAKVVFESWLNLMMPMNQPVFRLPVIGMEVGDAYNWAVETILAHPQLSKFKYMLTMEHDNMPPPDGLLKLYESIGDYDAVGGLYWTKGDLGQPMIYGNPGEMPKNFVPQVPIPGALQPCNGLGMGFTLFKISMFSKVPKPWFKTLQRFENGNQSAATQDLYFFSNAAREGFRFASDNRVRVGHLDVDSGMVW